MDTGYIIEYIKRRMHRKGFKDFSCETVSISVKTNETVFIGAYNEYYFLVSSQVSNGTLIVGDSEFLDAKSFSNTNLLYLYEFTGNIIIEPSNNSTIEFIRVIPIL